MAIAKLIIERYFTDDVEGKLDQKLLEIDDQTIKTLIGKTQEKGVRQLKRGIGKIIDYCIGIWVKQHEAGKKEEKVVIDSAKVNEIIPTNFPPVEKDEEKPNKDEEFKIPEHLKSDEKQIKELQDQIKKLEASLKQNPNSEASSTDKEELEKLRKKLESKEKNDPETQSPQQTNQNENDKFPWGKTLLIGGVIIIGGGLVWFFWWKKSKQ